MTKRTLWLVVPWAIFAALAIGWTIYWFALANATEQRLRARNDLSVERIVRHGFPVLLRVELQNAAYAQRGWRLETERVNLHVNPLNPNHVTLQARAPIAFARADGHVTNISADALIATMRTRRGAIAVAGVEGDNIALDDPAEDGVMRIEKVVLNLRPDPRAAGEYQMAFEARALTLPRPVRSFEAFGQDVAQMRAAVVIEQAAALLQPNQGNPLGAWREAGGRMRFEALVMNWGPLETTGDGAGGLDEERRLAGELRLPIEEPAPVLRALADGPSVESDTRRAINQIATVLSFTGDDITLDVEAENGALSIEGLRIRALPPVY